MLRAGANAATPTPPSNVSFVVPVRLKAEELRMLDAIRGSDILLTANRSEVIRLLIRREWGRRNGGSSVVKGSEVATDFRTGRPSGQGKSPTISAP